MTLVSRRRMKTARRNTGAYLPKTQNRLLGVVQNYQQSVPWEGGVGNHGTPFPFDNQHVMLITDNIYILCSQLNCDRTSAEVISETIFVNQKTADDVQYVLTINILQYILEGGGVF